MVSKPAEPRIIDLLLSAGVHLVTWDLPAELAEPKSGPPITYDDLLGFHFDMEQDGWLEGMVNSLHGR
jgi:hypothetical protein